MRRVCTYRVFNGLALFDHTGILRPLGTTAPTVIEVT
jgi:hypothetical protein